MLVYVFSTALSVVIAVLLSRRVRWRWLFPLAAVPLILVSVARWRVGTDFAFTYLPEYRAAQHVAGVGRPASEVVEYRRFLASRGGRYKFGKTPEAVERHFVRAIARSEPTHRLLLRLAVKSGLGLRLVTGVNAIIALALVFFAIGRQSRWPSLAVLFFVLTGNFFLSLNVMRQFTAVAIGVVAVSFIANRQPVRFLVAVGVAMLFHYSAVVLLPAYALSGVALTPRRGVVLIGAALCLGCLLSPLIRDALLKFGLTHYSGYFRSKLAKDGFEWMLFAINACFLLMGAWYWKTVCSGNRLFAIWYGLTVMGTISLSLSGMVPLMKRINYYYAAPHFLMLPEMLLAEGDVRRRRILTTLVVLAFVAETVVAVCVYNKNGVLPYRLH